MGSTTGSSARDESSVTSLAEHPHRDEVMALLAALPRLRLDDLTALGSVLRESDRVLRARERTSAHAGPWRVDLARLLGVLPTLFRAEIAALGTVGELGVRALADALIAAYAAPVLPPEERQALRQPWAQVREGAPGLAVVEESAASAIPAPRPRSCKIAADGLSGAGRSTPGAGRRPTS